MYKDRSGDRECSNQLLHCFCREHYLKSGIRGTAQSPSKNSVVICCCSVSWLKTVGVTRYNYAIVC